MTLTPRPLPNDCPEAYGDCTCACHRQPGIKHVMPCCYPNRQPETTMPTPPMEYRDLTIRVGNLDKIDHSICTLEEIMQRGMVVAYAPVLADICSILRALQKAANDPSQAVRRLVETPIYYAPAPTMMQALVAMRSPLRDLKQQRISEAEYHALPEDVKAYFTLVPADLGPQVPTTIPADDSYPVHGLDITPLREGVVNYPLDKINVVSQEEYVKRHPERAGMFTTDWTWTKPDGDDATVRGSTPDGRWAATVERANMREWEAVVIFSHAVPGANAQTVKTVKSVMSRTEGMLWVHMLRATSPVAGVLTAAINKMQVTCQSTRWVWSQATHALDTVRGSTEDGWAATVDYAAELRRWVVTITCNGKLVNSMGEEKTVDESFDERWQGVAFAESVRTASHDPKP